jgi:thiol-disulfide isomerase/thioredoxin
MALVESIVIPLGTKMPLFELSDPFGKIYQGTGLYGEKGLLVGFFCNHCPYAIAVWPRFIRLAQYAKKLGIHAIAINPNINPDYPEDSPEKMVNKIREWNIPFPYLVDDEQKVARDFKAQCTPDIYLFNKGQKLVYHGRVDDHWKDEHKVKHEELRTAIDNLANGLPQSSNQKSSMGCSIKWLHE